MMQPAMSIEINNLTKRYPNADKNAVDGLSLQIKKGIITGLLGPNGAGKTTTIAMLIGLEKPSSGQANILDFDIVKDSLQIRKAVGVVPQHIALFPQLTGKENFEYFARLYKIPTTQQKQIIPALLDAFGLTQHAHKKVAAYSGGMKRRANIIAGLLHQPSLVILDEPTAGVDIHSRTLILDFLKKYNEAGNTIIYTSHLLEEAERLCQEVIIIDEGKNIIASETKSLIAQTPNCTNLEDVFLHYTGRALRESTDY